MLTKKQVLKTIKEMPEAFSANELIDRIILLQKVEQATQEIKEGKGLSFYRAGKKTVEEMAELI